MKILKNLFKKRKSIISVTSDKYYLELDEIWLYNWEKCLNGDVKFVTKDHVSTELDAIVFAELYNKYLAKYGLEESLDQYIELQEELTRLRLLFIDTRDRMLLNQIDIEQENLRLKDPSKIKGMNYDECLVILSKSQGYPVRKKEITVVEFKALMDDYGRGGK